MLSLPHEILVELFRQCPALASELLAACAGIALGGASVERASIDLTQVVPAAYRSDAISVLRDAQHNAISAVIAEVQLSIDSDKRFSWPLYVAAARADLRCPVTLLVLAPDRSVARWARRRIPLGHPGYSLRPIVIGLGQIPRVTDPARAREVPHLAVLSALAHRDVETACAARASLGVLPADAQKLYWDVILDGLPALVRQAVEAHMIKGYQYKSDFARFYVAEGREEGRTEGRTEARESVRRAVIETVSARWPGLRDELATRLRDLSEAALVQVAVELGAAHDEDSARTVLEGLPAQADPEPEPAPAPVRTTVVARRRSRPAVASRRGRRAAST